MNGETTGWGLRGEGFHERKGEDFYQVGEKVFAGRGESFFQVKEKKEERKDKHQNKRSIFSLFFIGSYTDMFQYIQQMHPPTIYRRDMHAFIRRMYTTECRTERNHIKRRIFLKE